MRRLLQKMALRFKEETLTEFNDFDHLDREHSVALWQEEHLKYLYMKGIPYEDEAFMKKVNGESQYENDCHWMDGRFALYLFAKVYKLRVVLYINAQKDVWTTNWFDGRSGTVENEGAEGVVQVPPGERTFGMYYDGEHYEYIVI